MRLPAAVDQLSLDLESAVNVPYPPLGFVPFYEHELGNGDHFGLYWPIGREDEEPLVVESQHDSWSMSPGFSSLSVFLQLATNPDSWVEPPSIDQDPRSPLACYAAGRDAVAKGALEDAALQLRRAVTVLPEYGEAQWALSRLLFRMGQAGAAFEAACASILSPPAWGGASAQALAWLKRQGACPDPALEPLWRRRTDLNFKFGGSKQNEDYRVLREIIDGFIELGDGYRACLLLQSYGELLFRETVSFQARYGFSPGGQVEEQLLLARRFGIERNARLLKRTSP